jgi:hypothetical protein
MSRSSACVGSIPDSGFRGVTPPTAIGFPTNCGLSLDLDVRATQRRLGVRSKVELDDWMEAQGGTVIAAITR